MRNSASCAESHRGWNRRCSPTAAASVSPVPAAAILHRHSSFRAAVSRNFQFFPPVPTTVRARQRQHFRSSTFSLYRQQHNDEYRASQLPPLHLRHLREFHHHRSVSRRTLLGFTRPSLPKGAQKFSDKPECCVGTCARRPSTGTTPLSLPPPPSVVPARSASWAMILAARNGERSAVQHRQTGASATASPPAPPPAGSTPNIASASR